MPHPTNDDKLDTIIRTLERMDRRDRLRMIGGTIRNILGLIPLLLFLAGIWYLYTNGEELFQKLVQESAKQAAGYAQGGADFIEQLQKMIGR